MPASSGHTMLLWHNVKALSVIAVCHVLDLLRLLHPPGVLHSPEGSLGCCSCSSKGGFKGGRSRAGQESLVGLVTVSQLSYSQTSSGDVSLSDLV